MGESPLPLWIARLSGSQEEMGRQHGRMVRSAGGDASLDYYASVLEQALAGDWQGPVGALVRFAIRTGKHLWLDWLDRDRPSDLRARASAFARSTGRSPRHAHYLMGMDILQNTLAAAARIGLGPFSKVRAVAMRAACPACTSVMAWGRASASGDLVMARNFDFFGAGVWDHAPALVVCRPDHGQPYAFVTSRGVDTPAVTVFNEAGLVLAPHTRFHRDFAFGGAAIVDITHEIARRAENLDDAVRLVRELGSSSTWGIAVGSARERRGLVIEMTATRVEVVEPAPGAEFLVCANRYHHPALKAGEFAASEAWALHSDKRERRLRALMEGVVSEGGADPRALVRMLGDRQDPDALGVVRRAGGILAQPFTVQAAVIDPLARRVYLGVDAAPSCEGTWAEVELDWDGPVGGWDLGVLPKSVGVRARVLQSWARPHDEASGSLRRALMAHETGHDTETAVTHLEQAIHAAPDDPSLHLLAVWMHLGRKDAERALTHATAGLSLETETYRRGQLLLWGSRAALAARKPAQATTLRRELLTLAGRGVRELQTQTELDAERGGWRMRRPDINLMLVDAR